MRSTNSVASKADKMHRQFMLELGRQEARLQ
jgi:hypothetical protein